MESYRLSYIYIDGREYLVEAVEGGVRIWLWSKAKSYYDKYNCEYEYLSPVEMKRDFIPLLGDGYEFMSFLRVPMYLASVRYLGNCYITRKLSNMNDTSKFVCFELYAYCAGHSYPWNCTGLTFDKRRNK